MGSVMRQLNYFYEIPELPGIWLATDHGNGADDATRLMDRYCEMQRQNFDLQDDYLPTVKMSEKIK